MAKRTTEELLAQVPLFKDFSKKHLQKVASLMTRIDVQPGKELTHEGGHGQEFIVILEGDVEIRHGDKVIASRGAGDYVGEISLLDDRPRTATVVATTPAVIDVIGRREFMTLLHDEPEIGEKIKATAEQRLKEIDAADKS